MPEAWGLRNVDCGAHRNRGMSLHRALERFGLDPMDAERVAAYLAPPTLESLMFAAGTATKPTTQTTCRTEDRCETTFASDRVVKAAKRWTPNTIVEKRAGLLDVGDYIETSVGWSSIVEIHRT
mgnify:CR=1 FL=1